MVTGKQRPELSVSEIMKLVRTHMYLTEEEMAKLVGIGRPLYIILEEGGKTTPMIAKTVARFYDLTDRQVESLIPAEYDAEHYEYLVHRDDKLIRHGFKKKEAIDEQ